MREIKKIEPKVPHRIPRLEVFAAFTQSSSPRDFQARMEKHGIEFWAITEGVALHDYVMDGWLKDLRKPYRLDGDAYDFVIWQAA